MNDYIGESIWILKHTDPYPIGRYFGNGFIRFDTTHLGQVHLYMWCPLCGGSRDYLQLDTRQYCKLCGHGLRLAIKNLGHAKPRMFPLDKFTQDESHQKK